MLQLENKVRRFDLACALETAFEQNEWKGDVHCKGVFFTDKRGYCVNKVLAIRIEHEEEAPDVFYSFHATCLDNKVVPTFPYQNMETKPKKHHLLINKEKIKKEDMDHLFVMDTPHDEVVFYNTELLESLSEKLPNKRERDRTQLHIIRKKVGVHFEIVRLKRNEKDILSKQQIDTEKYLFHETDEQTRIAKVNANTLHTVLQIFEAKTEVSFRISHDRIKITGELSTLEGKKTQVDVVLALMKG